MKIAEKINTLVQLGEKIIAFEDDAIITAIHQANINNKWFTHDNIKQALRNIQQWLKKDSLYDWISDYDIAEKDQKSIGIVMAGNIPLVNFHDLLCCIISGHKALCKLSGKDEALMNLIVESLYSLNPNFKKIVAISEKLNGLDAIIATGSNNSFRYFDHYFGDKPHIFRKNRNSVAILNGNETAEEFDLLGHDIFDFYGLGCRNVSKLFFPKEYNTTKILDHLQSFQNVIDNNKYKNNFDYNLSILLLNRKEHWHNEFVILQESSELASPTSILYFEYYDNNNSLKALLDEKQSEIQCMISKEKWHPEFIPFGQAQTPQLNNYADNIDTMSFLSRL